jgi:predicted acylesterase/phospholipase RssA
MPLLGVHEYALPQTVERLIGPIGGIAEELAASEIELVVCATDVGAGDAPPGWELTYSSRRTQPEEMGQAILASAAISALVLPLPVGDRIATDGSWVRNFPLGHAYDTEGVELIVAFRFVPEWSTIGAEALVPLRRRLQRFRRVPPIRAFLAELREAEARAERGEPAHVLDMIVRLMRVAIARNTTMEERPSTVPCSRWGPRTGAAGGRASAPSGRSRTASPRRASPSATTVSSRGSPSGAPPTRLR